MPRISLLIGPLVAMMRFGAAADDERGYQPDPATGLPTASALSARAETKGTRPLIPIPSVLR